MALGRVRSIDRTSTIDIMKASTPSRHSPPCTRCRWPRRIPDATVSGFARGPHQHASSVTGQRLSGRHLRGVSRSAQSVSLAPGAVTRQPVTRILRSRTVHGLIHIWHQRSHQPWRAIQAEIGLGFGFRPGTDDADIMPTAGVAAASRERGGQLSHICLDGGVAGLWPFHWVAPPVSLSAMGCSFSFWSFTKYIGTQVIPGNPGQTLDLQHARRRTSLPFRNCLRGYS